VGMVTKDVLHDDVNLKIVCFLRSLGEVLGRTRRKEHLALKALHQRGKAAEVGTARLTEQPLLEKDSKDFFIS